MTRTLEAPLGHQDLGPTVDLVPLRPLHTLDLARLALDHHELSGNSPLVTYARTRRWAMNLVARRAADARAFVITEDGHVVGIGVLDDLRRGNLCNATLAVWVDREHRRRGIGSAAVGALCATGRDLGLRRLEASVLPDNAPARRLLAVGGFVPVGLARDYRLVGGTWQDHVLYERVVGGGL
jgi:[ribosomal protein S5]-alanine N-acetyltransferase